MHRANMVLAFRGLFRILSAWQCDVQPGETLPSIALNKESYSLPLTEEERNIVRELDPSIDSHSGEEYYSGVSEVYPRSFPSLATIEKRIASDIIMPAVDPLPAVDFIREFWPGRIMSWTLIQVPTIILAALPCLQILNLVLWDSPATFPNERRPTRQRTYISFPTVPPAFPP